MAVTHESPDLDALVFSARTTEADALATLRCEYATVLRPSLQWLARGVAAFLAAAIVLVIAKRGPDLGTLVVLAVCVYIAVVLPWERELWIRWRYWRRTEEGSETTVRLSASRLRIESELLRMEFAWSLIQLAVDHRAGRAPLQPAGAGDGLAAGARAGRWRAGASAVARVGKRDRGAAHLIGEKQGRKEDADRTRSFSVAAIEERSASFDPRSAFREPC